MFLVIISLIFISVIKNELTQMLVVGVCTLAALWILYKNLAALTIVTTKDLKLKALRQTTIFNMVVIGMCIVGAVLTGTGMVEIGPAEKILCRVYSECSFAIYGVYFTEATIYKTYRIKTSMDGGG